MSRGTKLSAVRIDDETRTAIEETITRRNFWSRSIPWSLSDFLRIAALEKIAKMNRSRKKRPMKSQKTVNAAENGNADSDQVQAT